MLTRLKFMYSISIILLQLCFLFSVAATAVVQMRIVKDTANYGYFGNNLGELGNNNQLAAKVYPANFTGPKLFRKLIGKCYNLTGSRYRYELCPFQNITQYELSARWNAYQGILGIWNEWIIENNTFSSMVYSNGDQCGDINRSVTVHLHCGYAEILSNVTEPRKCRYQAIFTTRYACHEDSLLVYPRLPAALQKEWDDLLTYFHYGDLTEIGYNEGLRKIFQQAGLIEVTTTKPPESSTSSVSSDLHYFIDLNSCNKEFKNLQNEISQLNQEIEALKLLIDINNMQNRTNKPQKVT
ncbi:N-acetylglucosamine-1-phosphotransferase subunit gamma-like [Uloborus diversus]|uniref:N-acetylglucosamine-1-phosphotransferase subunit gamma-like n=1 Tax=Uloborus diversus TaxID=327109 RepID=UPI0024097254|nr:N-acetylglucosamine-1-phosphotransferase subunit gamma-like [Uloborus diversus]